MASEKLVRNTIVAALDAVAVSSLGFQTSNIKDYFPEYEQPELLDNYLQPGSESTIKRAVAVWVEAADRIVAVTGGLGNVTIERAYSVYTRVYCELGDNGAGVKDAIDTDLKIRGAILSLDSRLGGIVTRLEDISEPRLSLENTLFNRVVVLERVWTYSHHNALFTP